MITFLGSLILYIGQKFCKNYIHVVNFIVSIIVFQLFKRCYFNDSFYTLLSKIEPSASPWTSPMVPVKKRDGSIRLCIDFRKVNSVTVPDPYNMPLIEEMLDQVGEAVYLSKLDLTKDFYQIPLDAHERYN